MHGPSEEYPRRLQARRAVAEELDRRHRLIGNLRLATVIAVIVIAYLAFGHNLMPAAWLAAPGAAFVILVVLHERVLRARDRCARSVAYYERALARLDDRWEGAGETGERFADKSHPYAADLDLFGPGSLYELLSAARTRVGEETLANWLREAAPPDRVRERQAAVEEMRTMLDLREDLAVLAGEARGNRHPESLAAWGERPPLLHSAAIQAAAGALAVLGIFSLIAWTLWGWRDLALAVYLANALFWVRLRNRVDRVSHEADEAASDLALLAGVLARLERERFHSPRLAELRAALDVDAQPPSLRIRRLNRLMELLDSRDHLLLRALEPLLLWSVHFAFAVERWRKRSGPAMRRWLQAVGEMEAISSLAGYAYEHPSDPFPEFVEGRPLFQGEGLAHPLLPQKTTVRNDVSIGEGLSLVVISGSNMSGKSTLLRTIGVNAVLAQAGAPVRATRLRMSPLALGASIRIVDSLHDGTSRFYAEITRLRQIVGLTGNSLPVLFLLDEFLQGTNSHDRRVGAEAVLRRLVKRGAIGLLTTHDLALTEVAAALGAQACNVHFEDRLEDGKLRFDYRLRPGVVQKSNALELMRSVGLEV